MQTATITVPFTVRLDTDGHGFSCFERNDLSGSTYAKPAKAKRELRAAAIEQVNEALQTHANRKKTLLWCGDPDTVLVIFCNGGNSWGYSQPHRSDRRYACGVLGFDSHDEALQSARRHADQSYGGVEKEVSI